jgi:hypothetical protein
MSGNWAFSVKRAAKLLRQHVPAFDKYPSANTKNAAATSKSQEEQRS